MCGDELTCSDLVIAYFYAGEFNKALELSTRLIAKFPRKYEVVMTYAAALELTGNFKEALRYIEKGIALNSASHENSEWIHVAILKDRIAGGTSTSILGLDFGNGEYPLLPKGLTNKRQTLEQLSFQLTERYYFIPKSDRQFGVLLVEYANLLYVNNFKTAAKQFHNMAADYGYTPRVMRAFADTSVVQVNQADTLTNVPSETSKRAVLEQFTKKKEWALFIQIALAVGFLGFIVLFAFWIRRKK